MSPIALPWPRVSDDYKPKEIQDNLDALSLYALSSQSTAGFNTGDLKIGAYATPDDGWLLCDGSAVSRIGYSKLFAKIGTTFGVGDGSTTFNLPDFRGRAPVGTGTGDASGATAHTLGSKVGKETHALSTTEMPSHTHDIQRNANQANSGGTGGIYGLQANSGTTLTTTQGTGGGAAHENRGPRTVVNFFIKT